MDKSFYKDKLIFRKWSAPHNYFLMKEHMMFQNNHWGNIVRNIFYSITKIVKFPKLITLYHHDKNFSLWSWSYIKPYQKFFLDCQRLELEQWNWYYKNILYAMLFKKKWHSQKIHLRYYHLQYNLVIVLKITNFNMLVHCLLRT